MPMVSVPPRVSHEYFRPHELVQGLHLLEIVKGSAPDGECDLSLIQREGIRPVILAVDDIEAVSPPPLPSNIPHHNTEPRSIIIP
jgi:hypothetical protein